MENLIWKTKTLSRALTATPFKTEHDFETTVFDTPEILGDICFLKRQVRGGGKSGIPDIIGIDKEGNVCIIEMKNVAVDAAIIPQVLEYAIWAETSPDSIKTLWLECKDKPDDVEVTWDSLQVRIIVVAPSISHATLDLVNKINYPVELIEVRRWTEDENEFMLVQRLEPARTARVAPVSGLEVYDDEFYLSNRNRQSAEAFLGYVREVEAIIRERGWALETKRNKAYVAFKAGFFIAFEIEWQGTKTFAFGVKLAEDEARRLPPEMTKYVNEWKYALYYIEPGKTKTEDFIPLFEAAYKRLIGE
jgi:hypothetical protein